MRKALAMRWAKALRSGDYKQGQGELRTVQFTFDDDDKLAGKETLHCCLGVLYEIEVGRKPKDHEGKLSAKLLKRVGLDADVQEQLITYNDGTYGRHAWSFKRIATWIEKNHRRLAGEKTQKRSSNT